jgi:hypothetical protein
LPIDIAVWYWIFAVFIHRIVFIVIPIFTIVFVRVIAPLATSISILSVPNSSPKPTLSIPGLTGSVVYRRQGRNLQGARRANFPMHHHYSFH